MLRNLGEIYNYTNDRLLEGELEDISDVIEYFEEFQNKVTVRAKLEAPPYTVALTSNVLVVPENFLSLARLKVDGKPVVVEEVWGRELSLQKDITTGSATLYYYRRPTPLDPENLSQVPDIDSRYLYAMGQYAAKMYYMVDDDDDMVEKFKESFFEGMTIYSTSKNTVTKINNVW